MASFNKVILMGNVTRNPDVRNLPSSSTIVATTGMAVNRRYKDKEEVMFIDITAYGKQAEVMGEYVTKGSSILVEGRLVFRQWEQDGQKRSKHEVIIESFQMVGGRRDMADFDETEPKDNYGSKKSYDSDAPISEEDVPF